MQKCKEIKLFEKVEKHDSDIAPQNGHISFNNGMILKIQEVTCSWEQARPAG